MSLIYQKTTWSNKIIKLIEKNVLIQLSDHILKINGVICINIQNYCKYSMLCNVVYFIVILSKLKCDMN
jgi:hypothetical protein